MYPYNKYLIQSYLLLIITTAYPCEVGYAKLAPYTGIEPVLTI